MGVSFLGAAHSFAPQDGDGGALLIPNRISSLFLLWSSLGSHHQLQFSSSSSSLQSRPSRTHFHNIESNGYVLSFIFIVSIVVGSLQAPSVVVVVFFPPFVRR